MSLFPELKKSGFRDLAFYLHVTNGFKDLKQFWTKRGKCTKETDPFLFQRYGKKGASHTAVVNIRNADGCADIRVFLAVGDAEEFVDTSDSKHEMSNADFLAMFKSILRQERKYSHQSIGFSLHREFKLEKPLVKRQFLREFQFKGLKFGTSEHSPIEEVSIDDLGEGKALLSMLSKPLFHLDPTLQNDRFFVYPMKRVKDWSQTLFEQLTGAMNAFPSTFY